MRKHHFLVLCCFLLMGKACDVDVTDPNVAAAINEVNATFRKDYKHMLSDIGTREYAVNRASAFDAMRDTLVELGFTVVHSESDYYLSVTGPAPAPLNEREWDRARSADEPVLKRIAAKHLGVKGRFAKLEPTGLNIDGIITFSERNAATEISITFRFREIKLQPPESILPRREYPPPTASRIAYEKIWRRFESLSATFPQSASRQ